jgi:hypothetical protein
MNDSTVESMAEELLKRLVHNLDCIPAIPTINMRYGLWSIYEPSDESYSRNVAPPICLIKQMKQLQKLEQEVYAKKSAIYSLGLDGDLPVLDFNKWMVSHVVPKIGVDPILYLYTSKVAIQTEPISIAQLFKTLDGGSSSRFLAYISDGGVLSGKNVKLKYDESDDRDEKLGINNYNLVLSRRVGLSFRKKLPSEYFLVLFLDYL